MIISLIEGWLTSVRSIASTSSGQYLNGYKNLLNQTLGCQVSPALLHQSFGAITGDRCWFYDGCSLVLTTAANARFSHWVSALELYADVQICQCPHPNCCEANHQLPSHSQRGEGMNLTTAQLEALQELIHTAVDRAARTLEHLINLDVYVEPAAIQVLMPLDICHELTRQFGKVQLSVASVNFAGELNGTVQFILSLESTARLLSIVNREPIDVEDLHRLRVGTFLEIASVLINHILETVIAHIHQSLHTSMPIYRQTSTENLLPLTDLVSHSMVLLVPTQLEVAPLQLVGNLLLMLRTGSFNTFLSKTFI
ncbi:hypothetical protein ACN4EK_03170 [Pantanalinema rosaneae CENA516]|uniref:hypothetical protein n=1 Tax=Pantanalinema rosaneae TaxID=1620701 RepID=UPI003D6DE62C